MRSLIPTETQSIIAFMEWARFMQLPFIHIVNEGKRSFYNGRILKLMGMRKGVSDLFLPVPHETFHGLWIEVKRLDKTIKSVSPEQWEWIELMRKNGYIAEVAFGSDQCIAITKKYLDIS